MAAHGGDHSGRRLFVPLIVLAVLILLGYWLRVHNLDAFSFWTDEGLTPERSGYAIGRILRNEILIQGYVTKDTHPPLYYLVIHVTRALFGTSDFAFRYPSVLAGVLLIPLLYQFGRRLATPTLGLIVALLAAVNPLQVYYGQEARMYTLLALLVTAMSYVLWRALSDPALDRRGLARALLLYGLLAALALYTHYTVAFLIAAQALFWAWLLWRRGLRWLIIGAVVVAALAAVPLIPYTIPRLFSGAEANYRFVSPLVMLQDVVHFFTLGLTTDFSQSFVRGLDLIALGLALLGLWAARPWLKRFYLLAWLLAVVLGLMAGSILFKPMYQGVRHIMAGSPAWLLLLGFGIHAIWTWLPASWRAADAEPDDELTGWSAWVAESPRFNPLGGVALLLVLIGAAVSLVNLYTNPAYVKDDFRAIVRFIEQRAGGDDVVVYNNAVLLPLHEHYRLRPDIGVTALPVYPQVATGAEPELGQLAADYERVWFITDPPADHRDDDGLTQGWFDANLLEVSNRLFPARTTEARVIGYATAAGDAPEPTSVTLPGLPELRGVRLDGPTLARPTLWVDLVWAGERPADATAVVFTLTGPDGVERYRRSHPLLRPAGAWDAAGPNRLSYDLPLPPGLPPGPYTLAVGPEGGPSEGIGEIEIAPTTAWPATPEQLFGRSELAALRSRPAAAWDNGLSLAAVELWDDAALPGNNLPLTVYWQAGSDGVDLTEVRYRLDVVDARGEVLRTQEARPGAPWLGRVEPGSLLREVTGLYFRPETPPGDYRLRWTLIDGETELASATAGRLRVEPWPLVTELPAAQTLSEATFGDAIELAGYDLGPAAGGALPLTLYWRASGSPAADYVAFVHLVSDATGEIVAQTDGIPAVGLRPTRGWRPGEVITDAYSLSLPGDLPPGRYHVDVGLYTPDDGQRLPVVDRGEPQPDNRLRLGTVDLP